MPFVVVVVVVVVVVCLFVFLVELMLTAFTGMPPQRVYHSPSTSLVWTTLDPQTKK